MKLYEVPRNTRIRVPAMDNEELMFDHIDGMYSVCRDKTGEIVHLNAFTDVEVLENDE